MKIIKLICFGLISLLVLAGISHASPFLVCDPQAGVVSYEVEIRDNGNVAMVGIVAAEPDTTLRYDLAGITNGVYTAYVKAGNLWGWSDASTFGFIVEICSPPANLRIIKE